MPIRYALFRLLACYRPCWNGNTWVLPQSGAKMANFKELAPHFAAAGVPLSSKDIREIITEQRSAATKVLFQLRTSYEKAQQSRPKRPLRSAGDAREWKRETADELISDPAKRADAEFVRKAMERGDAPIVIGQRPLFVLPTAVCVHVRDDAKASCRSTTC
jgi:hypothetical protein